MLTARFAVVAAACALYAGTATAANIKFATYVPPQHAAAKFIEKNLRDVAARSHGAMTLTYLPSAQLGPPPKYYDMAMTGQADITWFLHGNTPGLFPLTEVASIPLLIGSAEIGTRVLDDPEVKKYLLKEHEGLHILDLHTHQPANIFTGSKPIRAATDFKGLRLRVPTGPVRDLAVALGAVPDGTTPTEWSESLQKGTIDGVFTDYGGAGVAFRIGPVTKFATELYVYVGTFCVCMNERSYQSLPAAVRKDLDDTFTSTQPGAGKAFDSLDDIGKKIMMSQGTQPIILPDAERAKIQAIAAGIAEEVVSKLEKKGLPGRELYALMQKKSAEYAKISRNFWKR